MDNTKHFQIKIEKDELTDKHHIKVYFNHLVQHEHLVSVAFVDSLKNLSDEQFADYISMVLNSALIVLDAKS